MSSNGRSSSAGGQPPSFDPSLLNPIVRTKRTPMACVECRRRQVKCSGTSPRCDRCQKKGIECTYMSLSEQRAVTSTGGSISRSGTPQGARGGVSVHAHRQHHGRSHSQPAHLTQEAQGYSAGAAYAAPQGWREPGTGQSPSTGHHGQLTQPGYPNAQMGYPQNYAQQVALIQSQGAAASPGGTEMYGQGYAGQQAYVSGTTYDAFGHVVPTADPRYAYQVMQMEGVLPGDPQT
ncbi:hypothetical protein BN946_scf185043.g156 [Trametes cinnabarina]|uniref:Zn(2)-C6 fungal-type domain-containing protein n=1 Tax=Pycnoporus cinnabarinus TaxID=5643 RepID=A0A060SIS3_PYCCI|nr:hypothetical protein BN946_scf185043.g156 [Trametes cinnabarina]